jgi:Metal-dependent hydrolase
MIQLKKILWYCLFLVNVLTLTVLLLSSFSDYISPLQSVAFSYLGLFFPFIVAGNGLLFLFWIVVKKWKVVLSNLLVFLLCSSSIQTYFPINKKTENIPENCIKLLSYNVMRFGWVKKDERDNPNKILQYIKESNADIVCLQEYGESAKKSRLTHEQIQNALKDYPYSHIHHLKFPYKEEIFGLAIFSKFPILSIRKVPYDSNFNGSFIAELDINGKRVTVINNHLESNKLSQEERSDYYRLTQDMDSQSLNSFTKMMSKRLTPAFKIRAQQAQLISEEIKGEKNPYIIVCGDFNDTPISYARHKIKGNLRDAFVDSGSGLGITYNKYRFLFRIDYILHSKNIRSYNCTVGSLKDSDHYPISCYLQLDD